MSSIINGFIIISLITTIIYLIGLLSSLTDHVENKCDMTYMFEYPQYVRIANKVDEQYPKYALYAYSEGRLTERARDMFFEGIPVLFIPGNAGSHRQVRSLASIAMRKAINGRYPYHFNYFCIDLNEELSGLNGGVLNDQLKYVNASIYTVLDLYKNRKTAPTSIVLVGHSMGGIIAAQIVASLPANSGLIPILISLSSPHRRHPLDLDAYSHEFYKKTDLNNAKTDTTLVSVTGGYSDFVVPAYLTRIAHKNSINVVSTQIPISWLPADHLCILWCKQTILALNRALFDSVDAKTKQISTDPGFRRRVFKHNLIQHSGTKLPARSSNNSVQLRNQGQWIEQLPRQYTIQHLEGVREPHFHMVRLLDNPQHRFLTLVALNVKLDEWVYACGAHIPRGTYRVCQEFTPLSHLAQIAPSAKHKRRILHVDMHEMMRSNPDLTHIVIRVLPTSEPVTFYVDVHAERRLEVTLPHMLSLKRQILIEETPEKIVNYDLVLPQLQHVMQSYQLSLESVCAAAERHATASLMVPWGYQNVHKHFVDGDVQPLHVRLYESRPANVNGSATVRLTLDPGCRYRVSVKSSILGWLGQLARFYTPLLLVNVSAVVLMALNAQLRSIEEEGYCSIFFVAVKEGAKPYYILTIVKLISRVLCFKPLTNFLPNPDWLVLTNEGTDFFLLPLLLYMVSVGVVWLLGILLCISLIVFETTVHKFALKFLAKTVTFTISFSDHLMSGLHKIPFVVAGALVFLTLTTTGSLALCVGAVFYFMRLTQLSQDYIEELVWFYVKKLGRRFRRRRNDESSQVDKDRGQEEPAASSMSTHNAMFFHATLFMIWCTVTLINIPSALTWAHNFKFSTELKPDPAFVPGLTLSLCALPLWQLELPKVHRRWYGQVGKFVVCVAVASLIYAPLSIYRLNYLLSGVVVVVTLHQVLAKDRDDFEAIDGNEDDDGFTKYETVKAKLE